MRKPKIVLDIIKEDNGFSAIANIADKFIGTQGDTLEKLKINILEAVNLAFSEDGISYRLDEIELRHIATKTIENSLH